MQLYNKFLIRKFFFMKAYGLTEIVIIASYYRQLSADIKMKNYNIKTSFVSPQGLKAFWGTSFRIFILYSWKIVCNTTIYMGFQHVWKLILIQYCASLLMDDVTLVFVINKCCIFSGLSTQSSIFDHSGERGEILVFLVELIQYYR